jgi:RNA binding exosome subunit
MKSFKDFIQLDEIEQPKYSHGGAYDIIKTKMKENVEATEILFGLYENLSAENQEMFLTKLESDADALLDFATISKVE